MIIIPVLAYLISSLIIMFAGVRLAKYGDQIANLTGMGHLWVGTLLIGFATSLPEMVTTSSASFMRAPDIAVGNIFGSNIFNIAIIAFADLIFLREIAALRKPRSFHVLTVIFTILITNFVLLGLFIGQQPRLFTLAPTSLIILAIYIISQVVIFQNEKLSRVRSAGVAEGEETRQEVRRSKKVYLMFSLMSLLILVAGVTLAWSGREIVIISPIKESFMGNIFVALSTSLPELVTVFAAVRMQAFDLAIGDVFGSNLLNVALLFFADMFFTGDIYSAVDTGAQLYAVTFSMIMLGLLSIGVITKKSRKIWGTDVLTWIILGMFCFIVYTFYQVGIAF